MTKDCRAGHFFHELFKVSRKSSRSHIQKSVAVEHVEHIEQP